MISVIEQQYKKHTDNFIKTSISGMVHDVTLLMRIYKSMLEESAGGISENKNSNDKNEDRTENKDVVDEAVQYIRQHYKDVGVEKLAAKLFVSKRTLMRKFKHQTGVICYKRLIQINKSFIAYNTGGELKDVFGIWSEETDVLYPGEKNKVLMGGNEYDAVDYCDVIHTNGANVLAAYKEDYYADMPAFTVNKYVNGYAYYIAFRDCGDFLFKVYDGIIDKLNIKREIENLPKGVTVHTRENEKYKFSFVENYTAAVQTVRLNKRYCDVITETEDVR